MTLTTRRSLEISAALILLQGTILWAMGRVVISRSGVIELWENSIWSSENSQQIADWYSLGHINHGIVFFGLLALVARRWRFPLSWRVLVTALSGFLWETIENTDMVINRFRAVTISLDYYGDSVINSMSDSVFMLAGFLLAWALPVWGSVAVFAGLEALSTLWVRDGLILDTIMLLHPVEAIKAWQMLGR